MSRLSLGLAAALGPDLIATVAPEIERLGFRTLSTNDTPGADGLAVARAVLDATAGIDVGIGVVACDRRPAEGLADDIQRLRLPLGRCTFGVGSGRSARPLAEMRRCVAVLRERLGPSARIAVAALGPSMCGLAGELADVVLLNWMTPERIRSARLRVAEGAERAGRDPSGVSVAAYVRLAVGPDAASRLAAEADAYAGVPSYSRHFEAMGVSPASVGIASAQGADVASALRPYLAVLDEAVVRALPASKRVDDLLAVAGAAAG